MSRRSSRSTRRQLHGSSAIGCERSPGTMTALSTHDTKRSEDVRARISVISEIAEDWAAAVRRWNRLAPLGDGPLANLVWQAAVGAWPIERDRLHAYAEKAAREAGVSTALDRLGRRLRAAPARAGGRHLRRRRTARRHRRHGRPAPPVRLVELVVRQADPAHRPRCPGRLPGHRAVGSVAGRPGQPAAGRLPRAGRNCWPASTAAGCRTIDDEGAVKLLVTSRALRLRRDRPELFTGYTPVIASGPAADHVFAFDRGGALTVATRLPAGLARPAGWADTAVELPAGSWIDALTDRPFTGGRVPVGELLDRYPVALLVRELANDRRRADTKGDDDPRDPRLGAPSDRRSCWWSATANTR